MKKIIIGHRGCDEFRQNNTIKAFLRAFEFGAEMVEMDVRITMDKVMVVFHDDHLDSLRLKGHKYQDLKKYALDLGLEFPTLEEVLIALEGKGKLLIELKEYGYEKALVAMVLKYFTPAEFWLQSFFDVAVLEIKKSFPSVNCGLLLGTGYNDNYFHRKGFGFLLHKILEIFPWVRIKKCRADFISVNYFLTKFGLISRAKRKSIPTLVWTVNKLSEMQKVINSESMGVITDIPGEAIKLLKTSS